MNNENYIVIQGWMVNELKLKGTDLLVFALIHGFSQDNESGFAGSFSYIATSCGISKRCAIKSIQNLCEKDYITKQEGKGVKNLYQSRNFTLSGENYSPVKNIHQCKKFTQVVKNIHPTSEKNSPNNIYIYNLKDKDDNYINICGLEDLNNLNANNTDNLNNLSISNTDVLNNNTTKPLDSNKKKGKKENIDSIVAEVPEELQETVLAFVDMRKAIKKPITPHGLKLMLKKLNELSKENTQTAKQILEQSISGSWTGIYELKQDKIANRLAVVDSWLEGRDDNETDGFF